MSVTITTTARISDSVREHLTAGFVPYPRVASFLTSVARRCAGGKPFCSVRVGLRGGEGVLQDQDNAPLICNRMTILEAEDRRNSRGYERANSSSDFTSFSLASSVRSTARYLVRASPGATRSFAAPQVNSALPYLTATTSAIIRA